MLKISLKKFSTNILLILIYLLLQLVKFNSTLKNLNELESRKDNLLKHLEPQLNSARNSFEDIDNFTKNKQIFIDLDSWSPPTEISSNFMISNNDDYTKFLYNLIGFDPKVQLQSSPQLKEKSRTTVFKSEIELFEKNFNRNQFEVSTRTNFVIPGTRWCGVGNKAPNENALGFFYQTDLCCRDHDLCADQIPPSQTKYGLLNNGFFTRSHCDCDRDFYYCLKAANTLLSYKVGFAYFNLLKPQCFREEFPIVQCVESYKQRCSSYLVDDTKTKVWQWFDNRSF